MAKLWWAIWGDTNDFAHLTKLNRFNYIATNANSFRNRRQIIFTYFVSLTAGLTSSFIGKGPAIEFKLLLILT